MLIKLIFFIKKRIKYNKFHKKYFFSQKKVQEILHKVRYNIPTEIFNHSKVNFDILKNLSLDIKTPLFVERAKNIDFSYAKSLYLANKICPFNLVIVYSQTDLILPLQKYLKTAKFLMTTDISLETKITLFSLNINTKHLNNFSLRNENKIFIEKMSQSCNSFKNFCYNSECGNVKTSQTFYNGNYYFFENKTKNNKKINILIKKIIKNSKNNYFLLKKSSFCYELINLNFNKSFFIVSNMNIKNIYLEKVKASDDLALFIDIRAVVCEESFLYFGKEKIKKNSLGVKQKILSLIRNKFNYKILTKNNKVNNFFNYFLPKKIILNQIFDKYSFNKFADELKTFEEIYFNYKIKKIDEVMAYYLFKKCLFLWRKNDIIFTKNCEKNYLLKMFFEREKVFKITAGKTPQIIAGEVEYKNCCVVGEKLLRSVDFFEVQI